MPKRSRQPQSLFAALPADLRRQLGATPQPQVKTEPADDEYIDPIAPPPSRPRNPASLLSTQPPRLESPPADTAGPSNDNEGAVKLSSSRNASWVQQPRTARTETHGCSASAIAPQPPPLAAAAAASTSTSVVAVKRTREEWEQSFAANNKRQKTDAQAEANGGKKAKRGKKQNKDDEAENPYLGHPWDCTGLVPRYTDAKEVPDYLKKYFYQRHSLFPSYSRLPLLLDDEGWFSVTPQAIAHHMAQDWNNYNVVLDAFCGVGGNAIAFAQSDKDRIVIAMDIDPTRLAIARHNALHHGVADRIEFILGDYVEFARQWPKNSKNRANTRRTIDMVFLSPPWGGPEYLASEVYPLSAIEPIHGKELYDITSKVSRNIIYFLPRNVDVREVAELPRKLNPGDVTHYSPGKSGVELERECVTIEEQWVGDKLKAVAAYFGALAGEATRDPESASEDGKDDDEQED